MDQDEDNIRPRTPPNIRLEDKDQSEDFYLGSGNNSSSKDRFTENLLKINTKPMQRQNSSNRRRRSSGISVSISARQQSEMQNESDVK